MSEVTSIIDVQCVLGDAKLANQLDWERRGEYVYAVPKRHLSDVAFKTIRKCFKRLGGRCTYGGFQVRVTPKRVDEERLNKLFLRSK